MCLTRHMLPPLPTHLRSLVLPDWPNQARTLTQLKEEKRTLRTSSCTLLPCFNVLVPSLSS
jgi:hypothetical protein